MMTSNRWRSPCVASTILFVMLAATSAESQKKPASPVTVSALAPASVEVGSGSLELAVRGTGFVPKSQVRLNGDRRATTFVSSTELRAALLAADLASARAMSVSVFTPGAGTSNAISLAVEGAATAQADTEPPRFTTTPTNLTIPATSPAAANVALVLPLAVDNSGSVTVSSVPAAGVGTLFPVGTTTVVYTAVDPSNNKATISSTITVTPQPPAPTMFITQLDPGNGVPGARGFALAVRGTGFTSGMVVRWNGGNRTTTFLTSSVLSAFILTSDLISPGTTSVTVLNPATGAETPATNFFVDASLNVVPRITALGRTSAVAGATIGFAINGDFFVPGSIARWNGTDLPATAVSLNGSHILGVQIPALMAANPGTYRVTVFNPGPNGGESNAATFTLTPP